MTEDSYTQAEIVRTLKRIEQGQAETNSKLDEAVKTFVTRSELDAHLSMVGRQIKELKDGRMSWPQIVTLMLSAVGLVVILVTAYSITV